MSACSAKWLLSWLVVYFGAGQTRFENACKNAYLAAQASTHNYQVVARTFAGSPGKPLRVY
jgi:hypothetical protein